MPISQNVRFTGVPRDDAEHDHPPGGAIARELRDHLHRLGWAAGDLENWRDVGWLIPCRRNDARLEIACSAIGSAEWLLQISPAFVPGVFGRLLAGRKPSASPLDCTALARDVHAWLSASSTFRSAGWRWDGPPEPDGSTAEPSGPER